MHGGLRDLIAESTDRFVAGDPGLGRLRQALAATVSVGTTLAVEYGVATVTGAGAQGALVSMLLGAVVAMMGSMALTGTGLWLTARTAAFFPVAVGVGMLVGIGVGDRTDLMLAVFVVVMFVAVFVRRFGLPFFFYGFMAWMGYFFAAFLHATVAMLPTLMIAVAAATAWVLLLAVTVLRTNPRRTLRRTVLAYRARTRAVLRMCADLLQTGPGDDRRRARLQRRLRAGQAGLADAALAAEGWSEIPDALAPGWSGPALRRRLLDQQQVVDRLVGATIALAETGGPLAGQAGRVAARIGARDDTAVSQLADRLGTAAYRAEQQDAPGWWPASHFAVAARELVQISARTLRPPEVGPVDGFTASVSLAMGNLPGSPSVARNVPARTHAWNPLARLDMTTRQAIQVAVAGALAIVFGRELSATRYYWAVIAAFVVFTGTGTRSETFVKGAGRVSGTLFGLVAAIGLANVTAGRPAWVLVVILASIFCGFYLVRVSYAYMIFFITIMVGQLYSVLHEFSDGLLVLRLEETGIGAAVGIVVALLVMPLSTRDTVRNARDNLLTELADLLDLLADRWETGTIATDLDARSRSIDNRVRELTMVGRPLTRPLIWGNNSRLSRHRLGLYAATAAHARALVVGARGTTGYATDEADACRALARATRRLTELAPGRRAPSLTEPLRAADGAIMRAISGADGIRSRDPLLHTLLHLHDVLAELGASPADLSAAAGYSRIPQAGG